MGSGIGVGIPHVSTDRPLPGPSRQFCLYSFGSGAPKRNHRPETPLQKGIKMKLKAFRIAATISTLAMVIAASGAGQKWAH
jgi:hypothetical protein